MANHTSEQNSFSTCPYSLDFDPQPVVSLPSTVVPTWILLIIVNGLSAPLIVYINFLIIQTVLKDNRLREASYNILIAILAGADLFVGLVVQPIYLTLNIALLLDVSPICPYIVASIIGSFCCSWSLALLTVLSMERYLAIEHPFFYEAKVTVPRTVVVSLLSCVMISSTSMCFRFISDGSYAIRQIPVAVVISSCCLVIIVCVWKVYRTARRQQREITAQREGLSQEEQANERKKLKTRLNETKRYFTLAMILMASVFLYLPSLCSKIIGVTLGIEFTPDFKYISQSIWATCVYLQSLANPLIVSLRLSRIKKGVKGRLVCKFQ